MAVMWAAGAVALFVAAPAQAHASLVATIPADGAIVAAPPDTYVLTFNEPVSPLSLRLTRPDGTALDLAGFTAVDSSVTVAAPETASRGTYVLSWRVVSEDGHPVGGSLVFSIGEVSAPAPAGAREIDHAVLAGVWFTRVALYVGLFVGVGGAFAMRWFFPATVAGNRIAEASILVGLAGSVAALGFQGLDAMGEPIAQFADVRIWATGFSTSFGRTVVLAIAGFLAAAVSLSIHGRVARIASLFGLLLVGAALAASGHASAAAPHWLMRPTVFIHAVGIAFWTGALVPLALAMRTGAPGHLEGLKRFSVTIPYVVALLAASGVTLAVVQLRVLGALGDTAYGRVLLVKLSLLVALFGLAAVNRWSLTTRTMAGDPEPTRRMIRSIAAETAIVLVIFAVAAMWRFTPPPRALAVVPPAQPTFAHLHSAKVHGVAEIDPGRIGEVSVSIYLADAGMQTFPAKEVTLVLSRPDAGIEPFARAAMPDGEAGWRVDGLPIPLPGTWRIRLDVLVDDFEMAHLEGEVEIVP